MIKVPGFVISQLLGRGTYGHVYMARKLGSSKPVAIKCIMKSKLSKQARDNLVSEISILKALEHPHIVCMLDFTWDGSFVYIIMEFCGGGDLGRFLRLKRKLDELLVQHFLQQLALALQYLKSKNIVHMDLKPQNILLTSTNNPSLKLADFGFAQCIEETAKKNEVRGTLLYMAPEIFREGVYHPSCDLWSIGIILYECLFGASPYGQITVEQLKERLIATDEPIKLPSLTEISKPCAALLSGLLKRNPSERLNHEQFFSHPFIDLDHVPSAQSLDKATEYLERAPRLESVGKLCEAYDCYLEGLNHLMAAYNYEQLRFKKSEIRKLMKEYLLKTESLKLELCLLSSHTKMTSHSSSELEPKTSNRQAVNLPDPIVPIKCYSASQQPKNNTKSSEKSLFHYLTKRKDDNQCQLKNQSQSNSETCQPRNSVTRNDFTNSTKEYVSTDSVERINDCLTSDKANILTRMKHWFSRQNAKTENSHESKHVPTAILVDVDSPNSSTPLSSELPNSPPIPPASTNLCSNLINSTEEEEKHLVRSQSVNSSTSEQSTIKPCIMTTSLDSSKSRNSQLESESHIDAMDMVDGLTEKFGRSRMLEHLGTVSNVVTEFLDKFYELISKQHLQEALIYFQNEFSNCLKAAQDDSNSKNRSILLKELSLAMDKAEQLKIYLTCNNSKVINENESSNFQIGEELFDENPQDEDRCALM